MCSVTAKVQAIIGFPVPQTKRALRRFLGMCGYHWGFCKNFLDVVAPHTRLVSPLKPFVWSSDCHAAFDSVKALLCSAPMLVAPNFERPFKLEDTLAHVMQELFFCKKMSKALMVCYFSNKFYKHHINYNTIEKGSSCLAACSAAFPGLFRIYSQLKFFQTIIHWFFFHRCVM